MEFAEDGEAVAFYDPESGAVYFAIGFGIQGVTVTSPGNFLTDVTPRTLGDGNEAQQYTTDTVSYLSRYGLPVTTGSQVWPVGPVLPAGLTADDIAFSFSSRGATGTSEAQMILATLLFADFDKDGDVDDDDFAAILADFGCFLSDCSGDVNWDGITDGTDVLLGQMYHGIRGRSSGPLVGAVATAVPEPASWTLVLAAILCLLCTPLRRAPAFRSS